MGKYDLQRLRLNHSIPMDDLVAELRPMYPKLDKPLLSKAINEGYGVELRPDAIKTLGRSSTRRDGTSAGRKTGTA